MSASIVAIGDLLTKNRGWTEQQRADLFRVAEILNRAGLRVSTEFGVSDEGDPWFVFTREDTSEVIAHFARIDGYYVAASLPTSDMIRARSFKDVVDALIHHQPLVAGSDHRRWGEVYSHPLGGLIAFVATALMVAQEQSARPALADDGEGADGDRAAADTAPARAEAVHGQVVALLRGTPPSPEPAAQGGWDWVSMARVGLTAAMIAATDAFAFDQNSDTTASDDLVGLADADSAGGERGERDSAAVQAAAAVESAHRAGTDAAATAAPADAAAADALHHDLRVIVSDEPVAAFVFQPIAPQPAATDPAPDVAANQAIPDDFNADSMDFERLALASAPRPAEPPTQAGLEHVGVSGLAEAAPKPANGGPAAAEPHAGGSDPATATAPTEPVAIADAQPNESTIKVFDDAGGTTTFVIGGSSSAGIDLSLFSLVSSFNEAKLVFASGTDAATATVAGPSEGTAASAATGADPTAANSPAWRPLSANVTLTGGGQITAYDDDGRNQTIRLGAEADVVMVTPGASHVRIENFTVGVDRFYVSQWLIDHRPPSVTVTQSGDVIMSFYADFSITLVGLAPPQLDHPAGV